MNSYYDSHIILGGKVVLQTTHGPETRWACYFHGEHIGRIEHREPRGYREKPYEAMTLDLNYDWERYSQVGWYDTLLEAKTALLEPARELLEQMDKHQASSVPVYLLPDADSEFFPTPKALAGMLMAGIDWKGVKTLLEPSAGAGHLLDYAKQLCKNFTYRKQRVGRDLPDIDCVELDSNLRSVLTGKGYRVVHDDFLDYQTRKHYDLVLMNPPFSHGDLHLLHAIELCAHGGQIACILNAETVRNPFTNSRKALMKELKRYGASIRYVKDGFKHSPRSTDVEVALINLSIPAQSADPSIWDDLQKAANVQFDSETPHQLAPGNQIDRLIVEYQLLCEAGITLMRKYNGVAPYIHKSSKSSYSKPIITLQVNGHNCRDVCDASDVNNFLKSARARYWSEMFDLPMLRAQMTSAMQNQYSSTIQEMRDYEFSLFNIQQVLEKIHGQLVQGVEEAIIKCFDKLSAEHTYNSSIQNDNVHYFNGWKSNKAHFVNNVCVIPSYGCFARGYKWDKHGHCKDTLEGLDVRGCFSTLSDLEKALDYLDKGETFPTNLEFTLAAAAREGRSGPITCKYFSVRFYKKGTCHIKFHDRKIVDRLNIYVGRQRAWLPPTYGKVRYEEMDEESRRVVDEFQGEAAYAQVMVHREDYIIDTQAQQLLLIA